MLCARAQSGSSVSEVNSPEPAAPARRFARPPETFLSNRASSQTSSTSSGPDTSSRMPPGVAILKIGPYSCAIRTKPPSGSARSMSKALPSSGRARGPGMSSRGPVASVCVVVPVGVFMVGSSGKSGHRTVRCERTMSPASATQPGKTSSRAGCSVVLTSITAAMR